MIRLVLMMLTFSLLNGCAWMVGTIDDTGRITDGNGNYGGYVRHDPLGGWSASCRGGSSGGTVTARCW